MAKKTAKKVAAKKVKVVKSRINVETFIAAYMGAVDAGLTRDEFAARLGVAPLTVYQRVMKFRSEGLDIPMLEGETGRVPVLERAKAALAAYRAA